MLTVQYMLSWEDLHISSYQNFSSPGIAIKSESCIDTLELTVCHESNIIKSKDFKSAKYTNLNRDLLPKYSNLKLNNYTIEVTTLGIISDISKFTKNNLMNPMHDNIKLLIFNSTISSSYAIYCNRNTLEL